MAYASEEDFFKYLRASYWICNENYWLYFLHLNPLVVSLAFFGGY